MSPLRSMRSDGLLLIGVILGTILIRIVLLGFQARKKQHSMHRISSTEAKICRVCASRIRCLHFANSLLAPGESRFAVLAHRRSQIVPRSQVSIGRAMAAVDCARLRLAQNRPQLEKRRECCDAAPRFDASGCFSRQFLDCFSRRRVRLPARFR